MGRREPAITIGIVTALITSVLGLLVAFGLDVSDEQRNALVGVIPPMFAAIVGMSAIIRQFVWSPNSVDVVVKETEADAREDAFGGPAPDTTMARAFRGER